MKYSKWYVVEVSHGRYYQTRNHGGPSGLDHARVYRTIRGARDAARRWGKNARVLRVDGILSVVDDE